MENRGKGKHHRPLLQRDIEAAQANSNSNAGAARWLGVNFDTYKKYAVIYGLYEQHKNARGVGISTRKYHGAYGLETILEGHHPKYSHRKLKARLLAAGKLEESCALCGFKNKRTLDNKCPLILYCVDGNNENLILDNLQLRCYNCIFLTSGKVSPQPDVLPHTLDRDMLESGQITLDDIEAMQNDFLNDRDDA